MASPPPPGQLMYPKIPERHSSHLRPSLREELESFKKRKTSAESVSSNVTVFLDAQIAKLTNEIRAATAYAVGLGQAYDARTIGKSELDQEKDAVRKAKAPRAVALHVLKRQRKFVEEELADAVGMPSPTKRQQEMEHEHSELARAYVATIVERVKTGMAKQAGQYFNQKAFKNAVASYYEAETPSRGIPGSEVSKHCSIMGWWGPADVKAAHIVPKVLASRELEKIFGVGDVMLSDPRNDASREAGSRWKVVITDPTKMKHSALKDRERDVLWSEIDGRELRFLGDGRPARRFLYFRFVVTFLICRDRGTPLDWAGGAKSDGVMWASPGPYLEKATLRHMARQISHHELPPAILANTFDDSNGGEDAHSIGPTLAEDMDEAETSGLMLGLSVAEPFSRSGTAQGQHGVDRDDDSDFSDD
ncbi:MAG: hypothetical protein M1832_003690 [Thelocarpon impressellum]|nr:MAG: hypothetical protein M1832_003690 [Thelocarpon impressellum]